VTESIGEVFLRCNAKEVVERCASAVQQLSRQLYGPDAPLPEVKIQGHLDATLTYIPSHLEYIVGELLRNSFQATIEHHNDRHRRNPTARPPPIEVLICETPQHVIFRISDAGGGVPQNELPHLWSFVNGPRRTSSRIENLTQVPQLAATLQEFNLDGGESTTLPRSDRDDRSLSSLSGRPPTLRLGIGLPLSRVFAEYWAGSLELHSLEGYGVDAFLQIQKLGTKNEQLSTRAAMDAL